METRLLSPDAQQTVFYNSESKTLDLLDQRRRMRVSLHLLSPPPCSLCWSPDSRLLAVGLPGGTLEILDSATGDWRLLPVPVGASSDPRLASHIVAMSFAPDSKRLAVGSSHGEIKLLTWGKDTRGTIEVVWNKSLSSQMVTLLAFSDDGSSLASARLDGLVAEHDVRTSTTLQLWQCPLLVTELKWVDEEVWVFHLGSLIQFSKSCALPGDAP